MEEENQQKLFDNRKLAALLIPLAVDQLLNSFMGTVDTLVVSNLGSAAISAVSLVDSINILIVQAFFALATGGTVVCSHYLGCRREGHAKEAARQLVFITFMMSLVIGVLCIVFNGQILSLIFGEVEDAVMENAKQYFFFSAISYPFIALYDDGSSILRAQENSRLPMLISVASNLVNLVLNLLFVWGLGFGVAGSACATLLARIFAMTVVMYKLRNPRLTVSLTQYHSIRPDWGEIRRILRIGIPSGVENSMFQVRETGDPVHGVSDGNCCDRGTGDRKHRGESERDPGDRCGNRSDDRGWRDSGSRAKGRSGVLCKEAVHHF